MPLGVRFKDSGGYVGASKVIKASKDGNNIAAEAISRGRKDKLMIGCEHVKTGILMDLRYSTSPVIKLSVMDARRFAEWILKVTARKKS